MFSRQVVSQSARAVHVARQQIGKAQAKRFVSSNSGATSDKPSFQRLTLALVGAGAVAATGFALISTVKADSKKDATHHATFEKYASLNKDGKRVMTADDFVNAITAVGNNAPNGSDAHRNGNIDDHKFRVLFRLADADKDGHITEEEYINFLDIIHKPDAEYRLAFKIFDRDGNGKISIDDFKKVVATDFLDSSIPFDFNCDFIRLYFGKIGSEMTYSQFTQLLKDLQQERMRQEFRYYDKDGSGYIAADKFANIITAVKLRRMPEQMKNNLQAVALLNKGTPYEGKVSYAQFKACNDMLLHMPSYTRVLRSTTSKLGKKGLTKEEFLRQARNHTSIEITPMEVDVIYSLFNQGQDGILKLTDLEAANEALTEVVKPVVAHKTFLQAALESVENFALGSIAGAIGATAVYPIDLVKTRMQNQRAVDPAQRVYKNSWDCFTKVLKNEGAPALYKGLGPQIVGVAPEKAIKLTVNDLLRGLFEDKSKGEIYFPLEVLAGGSAGASQVLFTNPLEIVKIRLQVQGEGVKGAKGLGAMTIIRELGFFGLYKGAGACLLRDIPFSAIYFPTYAKMKTVLADEHGKVGPKELLLAGAIAGIPAASLVTPADVIKTRLQVKARTGEQTYSGIRDCFAKVLAQEGPKAFFKGCLMRVFRSSPQFGVTLFSYEMLQRFFAPNLTPRVPTNAPVTQKDFASFSETVQKVDSMERKFGHITKD